MSFPLSDIQRLVVEQLAERRERDLLVSAGAGSGKTTILVESVLAALQKGVRLDQILVVTFTDKAATEMKNKIYRALGKREDLAHHRLRLPQAWISTIHSFCQRLLREHFEKAGVDPRFRVLSAEDAELLLTDATTRVFHERYARGIEAGEAGVFEQLVEMCGYGAEGENLRGVVRELLTRTRASEDPDGYLKAHAARLARKPEDWEDLVWKKDYAERTARAWREAIGLLRALVEEIPDAPRWTAFHDAVASIEPTELATPAGQRSVIERLVKAKAIKETDPLKFALPNLPSGEGKRLKPLRELVGKAFASPWLAEMPIDSDAVMKDESSASRYALALIELTREVDQAYEAAKARTGRLDFEDLQILALRLVRKLAESPQAVRFERVFIDEFQDVNGLQHQLLEQLCDPTRIFRVGDVKQSIYQFRLADPTIIRDLGRDRPLVRDRGEAPDAATEWNVLLPRNYRSLPSVIHTVNAIARGLFFEEEIGTPYDRQALVANREPEPGDPDVEFMIVREIPGAEGADGESDDDEGGEATEDAKPAIEKPNLQETEWGAIAQRIRELVASGTVRDEETGQPRPIGYADIAILLRAHAGAPALARRLEEEGIPCSVTTGESFFEASEVRDVTSLLRAVDNILDDIMLAASLRSPAFQWTDAELLAVRLAYPRAMHLAFALAALADRSTADGDAPYTRRLLPGDPGDPADRDVLLGEEVTLPDEPPFSTLPAHAAAALDAFLGWREAAGRSELPDLVGKILSETGLPRSVASLPGGLRRRGNLRKFHGITRRYARETGPSLTRFIRWLDLLRESRAKIFEAPVSSESVPAVRIQSIHKSKGLEFPVVIVAEMGRAYRLGARADALVPGRDYLGVRLLDVDTYVLRKPIPLRLLIDAAKRDDLAEEKRVLYVALTRARDRLIMSGVLNSRATTPDLLQRAYRGAIEQKDAYERAAIGRLLAKKAFPISWVLYVLPPAPSSDGAIAGLPLQVHWIAPTARERSGIQMNPIRAIETTLRAGAPAETPGGDDAEALAAIDRATRKHPGPLPGLLRTARGKIWATEFKSERDVEAVIEGAHASEGSPDEPAAPLVAPEAAASEGTLIHSLLERIEFAGMAAGNVEERIAAAAGSIGGIPDDVASMLRGSLTHLLTQPIGQALAAAPLLHREIAFSLRLSLLEVARWLPDLRAEILTAPGWSERVEEEADGALRVTSIVDRPTSRSPDPWVLVQGRIDLILPAPDGWVLLDWKSDRVYGEAAIDQRTALYKGQMEIYRRAVRALFGVSVGAQLYFLRPGILKEV
jgi:ATP-dependent helicase/nuclease subunit A